MQSQLRFKVLSSMLTFLFALLTTAYSQSSGGGSYLVLLTSGEGLADLRRFAASTGFTDSY